MSVPVLLGPARGHRFDTGGLRSNVASLIGRYEPAVTCFLRDQLQPGDIFFDVGANRGYYTRIALRAGAHVHAFEPAAQHHNTLQRLGAHLHTEPVGRALGLDAILPRPDVVKIDIEGAELEALGGAAETLAHARAVAIECHSMPLLRDVLTTVLAAGYGWSRVTEGGDQLGPPVVLARR